MSVVVDEHSDVVGVGNGTVCDVRPGPCPVYVHAGPAEGSVGEVAVVEGGAGPARHLHTVLPQTGVVHWGIKLIIREKYRTNTSETETGF